MSNQLLRINPFDKSGVILDVLTLCESVLNEGAGELFGQPISRWFKHLDSGGDVHATRTLEDAIKSERLRAETGQE